MDRETFELLDKAGLWAPLATLDAVNAALRAETTELSTFIWVALVLVNVSLAGLVSAIGAIAGLGGWGASLYALAVTTCWVLAAAYLVRLCETRWAVGVRSVEWLWFVVALATAAVGTSVGALVSSFAGPLDAAYVLVPPTLAAGGMLARSRSQASGALGVMVYFSWIAYVLSKADATFKTWVFVHLVVSGSLYCMSTVVDQEIRDRGLLKQYESSAFVQGPAALYLLGSAIFVEIAAVANHKPSDATYWVAFLCVCLFAVVPLAVQVYRTKAQHRLPPVAIFVILCVMVFTATSYLPTILAWLINVTYCAAGPAAAIVYSRRQTETGPEAEEKDGSSRAA